MRPELKTAYLQVRGLILQVLKAPLRHFEQSTQGLMSVSNRILIIRIDRVGDLVLTTPAFAAIKTAFPNSMLTVLASRGNAGLLLHHPWVDEVFVYDAAASIRAKIHMIKSLRARRFDIIIDPLTGHDVAPAVLACLIRAPIRIGFSGFGREVFFNQTAAAAGSDRHMVDAVLDLLHLIGVADIGRDPQLFLGTEELEWAGRWTDRVNPERKRLVGIHPGAYYETHAGVRPISAASSKGCPGSPTFVLFCWAAWRRRGWSAGFWSRRVKSSRFLFQAISGRRWR
jgi:hypothetical protein